MNTLVSACKRVFFSFELLPQYILFPVKIHLARAKWLVTAYLNDNYRTILRKQA